MQTQRIRYDDSTTRRFIAASVIFGVVGLLMGVWIALDLFFWKANLGLPWTSFGRLRPLHTNAVIFAFVGNMMFAGVYYSTQRLLKTRMASDLLSNIHFWGWQLIIVAAAVTLPLGITTSKEYAELEWPIDIAIALIWVVFAINFFWTLAKRNEKNLYVAIWFYIATIVTVAVLHIVNSLALPVSPLKSYSVYSGVQDALVQWWYGHNAVAFFLTTPILGIMYYFMPKAAERPVYSYRLSIVHFWSLVFMYIWAGPHHLLYTALPDWAQSLGMVFSVALWAPSWGGMINGLLTLRGGWDKLRHDPVIKFFAAGVTFYGMSTFEGPLLSIKSVSALAHYTDWVIGHVHSGALGWNGLMAAGMFYWLVPRLFGTKLHSTKAADAHFWTATVGILIYAGSMWVAGINQGLMLREMKDGALVYPNFLETLNAIKPMYALRFAGGTLYLLGFLLMAWNLAMTALSGKAVDGEADVVVAEPAPASSQPGFAALAFGRPVVFSVAILGVTFLLGWTNPGQSVAVILAIVVLGEVARRVSKSDQAAGKVSWFTLVEGRPLAFTAFTLVAVLIGGVAELLPTIMVKRAVPATGASQKPYTSLELQGRDIYVREGCYTCHSQMVRPMLPETLRYGEVSRAEEFIYDFPFQWGSKRTGPDLHRVGGRYPNLWHYKHMTDPRSTSEGSNMPPYAWLADTRYSPSDARPRMAAMQKLGVPYTNVEVDAAAASQKAQAEVLVADLATQGVQLEWNSELTALIAYLQRLGRDKGVAMEKPAPLAAAPAAPAARPEAPAAPAAPAEGGGTP